MIRQFTPTDTDTILDIWLTASIQAHDFVDAGFWISQTDNMRDIYLPMAETWVYEQYSDILGFCSLYEQTLAALFVAPAHQHSGIGTQLINHAKNNKTHSVCRFINETPPVPDSICHRGLSFAVNKPIPIPDNRNI